jgi:hypothetical protein
MRFLAPLSLLFALTIPVVVLFYMLKRKRVVKLVSSTVLWQRFLAESQASKPFQKLRNNWLLIIQVILLALVALALGRPYFAGDSRQAQLRVVVLDGSASMQATDEQPTRFDKAKAEALKWVDGLRDSEQMMVLLAGATTEVKQSPTSDKTALRRAIQSCQPSDAPARIADALKTASAFTYEKRGEEEVISGEIHLFSDGSFPPLAELENKNLPLVYHRVGQSGNNIGIVSLDVRSNPENPVERAVFAAVANFSTNAVKADMELLFDGQSQQIRALDLAPTNTQPLVFVAPQDKDRVFTVRLSASDDLATDNQASIVSLLPQPVKVILVTRGNQLLERALRALPNVRLTVASSLAETPVGIDLVVIDNVVPTKWPTVNILAIHTAPGEWFEGALAPVKSPVVVDWKSTHPLMRFVTFDNVPIAETLGVKAPAWAVSIVDSPQTPLILAGERDGRRIVWIGFDVLESLWPMRISFPIFMANAVEWLNPSASSAEQFTVRAGDPFRFRFAQPTGGAAVRKPDGTTQEVDLSADGRELVFGNTGRQGTYKLTTGTNEVTFCVNLLDSAESSITPREELPFGRYAKTTASTVKRANVELWRWIALAGLALLLFEWWYYNKRTA